MKKGDIKQRKWNLLEDKPFQFMTFWETRCEDRNGKKVIIQRCPA